MAKKSILVPAKKAFKNAGATVIGTALTGAGALGAGFIDKSFSDKLPAALVKIKGVLYFGLGTAMDMFVDNQHASNIGKGIATFGVMSVFNQYAPDSLKTKISSPMTGLGAYSGDREINWRELASEANETIEGFGTEASRLYGEPVDVASLY